MTRIQVDGAVFPLLHLTPEGSLPKLPAHLRWASGSVERYLDAAGGYAIAKTIWLPVCSHRTND